MTFSTIHAILLRFAIITMLMLCWSSCQSQTVTGIYAGLQLRYTAAGGGSMTTDDVVIELRANGVFNESFDNLQWQAASTGKYRVKNDQVLLSYPDGKTKLLTMTGNGNLKSGRAILIPLQKNGPVPALAYKRSGGTSTGGGVGGTPYIGAFHQNFIRFDGKGNFTRSSKGTVMISGDHIGGGTNSKNNDGGTYHYKDGLLTLQYSSGKSERHTFFFSTHSERIAVIDGQVFVLDRSKEQFPPEKKETTAEIPVSGLINKIKAAHGGEAIDRIRNLKLLSQTGEIVLLSYNDYTHSRSYSAATVHGKPVLRIYRKENTGRKWLRGKISALNKQETEEMALNRFSGIAVLHKDRISVLKEATATKVGDGYQLQYTVDGKSLRMIIDKQYRIIGEELPATAGRNTIVLSDFRNINGVIFPFREDHKTKQQKLEVKIAGYEINSLTENDWKLAERDVD